MAIKRTVALWTLRGVNEQAIGSGLTLTPAGTYVTRSYGELAKFSKALAMLDVTAVSGTNPTLDVTIQGCNESVTVSGEPGKWYVIATFPQQTTTSPASPVATGSTLLQAFNIDFKLYRAQFIVGGTASPTFTLTLQAICHTEEPNVRPQ